MSATEADGILIGCVDGALTALSDFLPNRASKQLPCFKVVAAAVLVSSTLFVCTASDLTFSGSLNLNSLLLSLLLLMTLGDTDAGDEKVNLPLGRVEGLLAIIDLRGKFDFGTTFSTEDAKANGSVELADVVILMSILGTVFRSGSCTLGRFTDRAVSLS